MAVYYNEIDAKAVAWLRELIKEGLIADGIVDSRSIVDVQPRDLDGYTQWHFFAGIGVWSYALRMNGWPDDRQVMTGSCPCQPFSGAGKKLGENDPRHLWPQMRRLVEAFRPKIVLGEQVSSPGGKTWLGNVKSDFESLDYAVSAADLCASSVGAPNIRQRLYWAAIDNKESVYELSSGVFLSAKRCIPGLLDGSVAGEVFEGTDGSRVRTSVEDVDTADRHSHSCVAGFDSTNLEQSQGRTPSNHAGLELSVAGTVAGESASSQFGGVAHADSGGYAQQHWFDQPGAVKAGWAREVDVSRDSAVAGMADTSSGGCGEFGGAGSERGVGHADVGFAVDQFGGLANSYGGKPGDRSVQPSGEYGQFPQDSSPVDGVGNTLNPGLEGHGGHVDDGSQPGRVHSSAAGSTPETGTRVYSGDLLKRMADTSSPRICHGGRGEAGSQASANQGLEEERQRLRVDTGDGECAGGVADTDSPRLPDSSISGPGSEGRGVEGQPLERSRCSFWDASVAILCKDGNARRIPLVVSATPIADAGGEGVEPIESILQFIFDGSPEDLGRGWDSFVAEIQKHCKTEEEVIDTLSAALSGFPLSGKVSGRVPLLRGAGNAINAVLAAEFIASVDYALALIALNKETDDVGGNESRGDQQPAADAGS